MWYYVALPDTPVWALPACSRTANHSPRTTRRVGSVRTLVPCLALHVCPYRNISSTSDLNSLSLAGGLERGLVPIEHLVLSVALRDRWALCYRGCAADLRTTGTHEPGLPFL